MLLSRKLFSFSVVLGNFDKNFKFYSHLIKYESKFVQNQTNFNIFIEDLLIIFITSL